MTPLQMIQECKDAMHPESMRGVTLTTAKKSLPKGFPKGELLNEMERNGLIERTYRYEPKKLLAYLVKHFPELDAAIVGASSSVAIEKSL